MYRVKTIATKPFHKKLGGNQTLLCFCQAMCTPLRTPAPWISQYLEERAALEMKYTDLCKPLYKEGGNIVAGHLDDKIDRIRK